MGDANTPCTTTIRIRGVKKPHNEAEKDELKEGHREDHNDKAHKRFRAEGLETSKTEDPEGKKTETPATTPAGASF
ncbi:hypothetical protein N0V85_006857 [Neurospora sp. IMI 360204]|nr:hypothetical protein N0V85_006857 [Neurospora sp. IMI 360204]